MFSAHLRPQRQLFAVNKIYKLGHPKFFLYHRINATVALLRNKMPKTQLLMLGILPRGDGTSSKTTYTWPGIYTTAIASVNDWLISLSESDEKISYLDCGPMLLFNGKVSVTMICNSLCGLVGKLESVCWTDKQSQSN